MRKLAHPNIRLQLDLGTIMANDEKSDVAIDNCDIIGHMHLSSPGLLPVNLKTDRYKKIVDNLLQLFNSPRLLTDVATIEMLMPGEQGKEEQLITIKTVIDNIFEVFMKKQN